MFKGLLGGKNNNKELWEFGKDFCRKWFFS